ncbi:hypothetical protein PQX77_003447 [Marasmius sp. AFHP31]|nr:hypothetical protein PQX77_003447 [Marasmius sp. AFHP31]
MPHPTHHDDNVSLSDMDTAWDDNEEVDELDTDSELAIAIGDVRGEEESVGIAYGQRDGAARNPHPDGVLSITLSNSKLEVRVGSEIATVAGSKLAGMMLLLLVVIIAAVLRGQLLAFSPEPDVV